jgi:hypothetical protein
MSSRGYFGFASGKAGNRVNVRMTRTPILEKKCRGDQWIIRDCALCSSFTALNVIDRLLQWSRDPYAALRSARLFAQIKTKFLELARRDQHDGICRRLAIGRRTADYATTLPHFSSFSY